MGIRIGLHNILFEFDCKAMW